MERHKAQCIAAKTVSLFLEYCMETDMLSEILGKHEYTPDEIVAIKAAIQDIANDNARSADFHKSMMPLEGDIRP